MKVAFWALGILVLGLFGIVMINLFGNITVTNQLNYTTMKNAVESSMYDSLDTAHYRTGFCLCTDKVKEAGKWVFNDDSEYELKDITYENGEKSCVSSKKQCQILEGEYRIDKKAFSENIIRRFAEMVNNKKAYEIIIQDIVEYPPKVSVRINSKDDEFSPTDKGGGYTIVNQIDAIIETWNGTPTIIIETPKPVVTPKSTTRSQPIVTPWVDVTSPPWYEDSTPTQAPVVTQAPVPTQAPIPTQAPTQAPTLAPAKTNSGGCFLPGTKIAVLGGYKDIDKLGVGDYVLTYNEIIKRNEFKKIIHVFEFKDIDEELYTITTDDSKIVLTGHHRLYTIRDGQNAYIAAEEMNIGDELMYSNGKYHKIENIEHVPIKRTVYNLEIEDNHNFYVGEKNILVHNAAENAAHSQEQVFK